MKLQKIYLKNYRNYDDILLELNNNLNIIIGDNAQGKTNILEAIYLSGTTKSHRGNKDKELREMFVEQKNSQGVNIKK